MLGIEGDRGPGTLFDGPPLLRAESFEGLVHQAGDLVTNTVVGHRTSRLRRARVGLHIAPQPTISHRRSPAEARWSGVTNARAGPIVVAGRECGGVLVHVQPGCVLPPRPPEAGTRRQPGRRPP